MGEFPSGSWAVHAVTTLSRRLAPRGALAPSADAALFFGGTGAGDQNRRDDPGWPHALGGRFERNDRSHSRVGRGPQCPQIHTETRIRVSPRHSEKYPRNRGPHCAPPVRAGAAALLENSDRALIPREMTADRTSLPRPQTHSPAPTVNAQGKPGAASSGRRPSLDQSGSSSTQTNSAMVTSRSSSRKSQSLNSGLPGCIRIC